jgi:hypothetical protein
MYFHINKIINNFKKIIKLVKKNGSYSLLIYAFFFNLTSCAEKNKSLPPISPKNKIKKQYIPTTNIEKINSDINANEIQQKFENTNDTQSTKTESKSIINQVNNSSPKNAMSPPVFPKDTFTSTPKMQNENKNNTINSISPMNELPKTVKDTSEVGFSSLPKKDDNKNKHVNPMAPPEFIK